MATDDLAVEFFGVRGSYPAVGPQFKKYGGNTSSLCIYLAGKRLIFDGGLGLIPLGRQAAGEQEYFIFQTHLHYDHLTGLPFFGPLFVPGNKIQVYTPASMVDPLKFYWGPPFFPLRWNELPARVEIIPTPEGKVDLVELLGLPDRSGNPLMTTRFLDNKFHPQDGVMLHRVSYGGKDIVYATDVELPTDQLLGEAAGFAMGADILICDTHYEDDEYWDGYEGFGHNSTRMTVRLAEAARVKQLVLFHHAPGRDDTAVDHLEATARQRFPNTIAAYEGLVITP